jgi:hypothetical protein
MRKVTDCLRIAMVPTAMELAMTREEIQKEINANYEAFVIELPRLLASHRDQFALMKGRKILGFYSSATDARTAGESFIADKLYSIQRVTDSTIDLGYFSHALPGRILQPDRGATHAGGDPSAT